MAPTISAAMSNCWEHQNLNHKLRKPLVEKLRRKRINGSIEQFKSLLGPEFLKRHPESKLEKADILEMAVCFRQLRHPAVNSGAADLGYSRCVQEVLNFLSKDEVHTQSKRRLLNTFSKLPTSSEKNLKGADFSPVNSTVQASTIKDESAINSTLWRPWQTTIRC